MTLIIVSLSLISTLVPNYYRNSRDYFIPKIKPSFIIEGCIPLFRSYSATLHNAPVKITTDVVPSPVSIS